ncbi:MAG: hypothetical protein ABSH06_00310 [Thermodesulfobacteriota bacterium]
MTNQQGRWFKFFGSHIDPNTGARVQVRNIAPFIEARLMMRKMSIREVFNPGTKALKRIYYYPDLSSEEKQKERDDAWDFAIVRFENFKNAKTGELISCTRENKLKLMKVPVFNRFISRCLQIIMNSNGG